MKNYRFGRHGTASSHVVPLRTFEPTFLAQVTIFPPVKSTLRKELHFGYV